MAQTLTVTTAFLRREHLPPVCFLTGQTDAVRIHRVQLHYLSRGAILVFIGVQLAVCLAWQAFALVTLILGPLILYLLTRRERVELPASSAYWRNRLMDGCMNAGLLVVPFAFGIAAMLTKGALSHALVHAIGISFLTMLLANVVWTLLMQAMRTGVRLRSDGWVDLVFKARSAAVFEVYRESWVLFQNSGEGRSSSAAAVAEDEEGWVEPVDGGWDQGASGRQ